MNEQWRDIAGYEGLYQVSNIGRVRSLDHVVKTKRGKDMLVKGKDKSLLNRKGYMFVLLRNRRVQQMCAVHRLVATAFIPNLDNKPEVNHIDANKSNNCVNNLEWVTGEENMRHAYDNGLVVKGQAVIMDEKIVFDSISKCAKHVGVDPHEIRRALNGEYKTVHGHIFRKFGT